MKLKQLKNIADIPKEFNLSAYAPTRDFDIFAWLVNLEFRVLTGYMQGLNPQPDDQIFRCEYAFKNPILTSENFENEPGLRKQIYHSGIRDFTAMDFFWHGRECVTDTRYAAYMDGFEEYIDNDAATYEEKTKSHPDMIAKMDAPFYRLLEAAKVSHEGDVLVKVDLHCSEEKIVADFKAWLVATRSALDIVTPKKKFARDDFRNWASNAVLPYLDLTLWAKASGFEFTQQLLGTVLFPDEYDVNLAERIRKVTAPAARGMAREVFTDALRSQALAESAEQESTKVIPPKYPAIRTPP